LCASCLTLWKTGFQFPVDSFFWGHRQKRSYLIFDWMDFSLCLLLLSQFYITQMIRELNKIHYFLHGIIVGLQYVKFLKTWNTTQNYILQSSHIVHTLVVFTFLALWAHAWQMGRCLAFCLLELQMEYLSWGSILWGIVVYPLVKFLHLCSLSSFVHLLKPKLLLLS
jgi:hypothetical protein